VVATGTPDSTSQGPRHRCLHQLHWWLMLELPVAPPGGPPSTSCSTMAIAAAGTTSITPRGPAIDVWLNLVHVANIFLATPTKRHHGKHYYYEQDKFREKIFWSPSGAKDPRNISARMFHSTNQKTMLFIYKKMPSKAGRSTHLWVHARTARLRCAQHLQRRP
jgi:hypothetical protein